MKKIFFLIFLFCLSISYINSQAKYGNARAISGRTIQKRILSKDDVKKYDESVSKGNTRYIKNLYFHYKLTDNPKRAEELLAYGLENDDLWAMCETYVSHKDDMNESEAEKLKKRIDKMKDQDINVYHYYANEIFDLDWGY